ncbi:Elongator complex protein 4 [Russula ochroleuca]|uniref:Elongator complex protein 4 n=1 Tax=Russula ochroleuca TaxID=152965 RepID=A0A9P5MXV9_9AGAM|nr:Elongator complex protein 4 [Russula ochroleuca]
MSTFKRKSSSKSVGLLAATRASPFSSSTILTSSGIASLDDILGGGLPLSCSLLVIAPDTHSSYGELVQKYFVSQGLASGQKVCVIDSNPRQFVSECMWSSNGVLSPSVTTEVEDKEDGNETTKVEIAWRYEHLKPFQTTVSASKFPADDFCRAFDLTYRVPRHFLDQAIQSSQLVLLDASGDWTRLIDLVAESLGTSQDAVPVRICIPLLGSPGWGDPHPKDVLQFVYSLRTLLRRCPHACASVGLPPYMSADRWGGPGWLNKLSWLFDASVTIAGFSVDPALSLRFPSYHGSFNIRALPAPHSLLSASDKTSTLRGIATVPGSSGENNIAFKCTRKRLVFETHHLDAEGGVGERRTGTAEGERAGSNSRGLAGLEVELEGERAMEAAAAAERIRTESLTKRKQVRFRGDLI